MTALAPSPVARNSGADISAGMVAAANGDTVPACAYLHVKNTSGAAVTVSVTSPAGGGPGGTSIGPFALTPPVAATTGDMIYGPLPQYPFGDQNGLINLSYSAVANVTVKALNIAQT